MLTASDVLAIGAIGLLLFMVSAIVALIVSTVSMAIGELIEWMRTDV